MARRIAEAGFSLQVWARRAVTLESFEKLAVAVSPSLSAMGAACDVACVCVRNDQDAEEVVLPERGGLLDGMQPGGTIVVHSTVHPETCRRLAAKAAERGVTLLDAPVSGGGDVAAAGGLTVMVGGDSEIFERCRPIFETYGNLVRYLGPLGSAQICKLLNNLLFSANLQVSSELLDLAESLGADPNALLEIVEASSGGSFALRAVPLLRSGGQAAALANLAKDYHLILDLAADSGVRETNLARAAGVLAEIVATAEPKRGDFNRD